MKIRKGIGELDQGVIQQPHTQPHGPQVLLQSPKPHAEEEISLGAARAIHQELNPETVIKDRRAFVDSMRAKVAAGKYVFPSSEELAGKVGDEINMEILLSKGRVREE
jgi:hypothetical protein